MIDWKRIANVREGRIDRLEHGNGKTTTMLVNALDYILKTKESVVIASPSVLFCESLKRYMKNIVEEVENAYITKEKKNYLEINGIPVHFYSKDSPGIGGIGYVFVDHGVYESEPNYRF